MATKMIPGDHSIVIYGAFHHRNTDRPRYRLNTSEGRLETIDENVVNLLLYVPLNDDGEPLWGNPQNGIEAIVTLDEDGRVTHIGPVSHADK